MKLPSAIYLIKNSSNGKHYVGRSIRGEDRPHSHLLALRLGIHPNQLMQEDWDRCGASAFVYEILESGVPHERAAAREQFWIEKFDSIGSKGYNQCNAIPIRDTNKPAEGFVRLTFEIPVDLARRLKIVAAAMGTTQTAIVKRAIEKELNWIFETIGPVVNDLKTNRSWRT